jgi:predicted transcriptional regulator
MNNEEPSNNQDWLDDLSQNQQLQISEGLNDVENGRVVTSEEFWKLLKAE